MNAVRWGALSNVLFMITIYESSTHALGTIMASSLFRCWKENLCLFRCTASKQILNTYTAPACDSTQILYSRLQQYERPEISFGKARDILRMDKQFIPRYHKIGL